MIAETFPENHRQAVVYRLWTLVSQPKEHHARLVQHAERDDVAKVESERETTLPLDAASSMTSRSFARCSPRLLTCTASWPSRRRKSTVFGEMPASARNRIVSRGLDEVRRGR